MIDPKTITTSTEAYKADSVWDQTQNILDLLDTEENGSNGVINNRKNFKKLCDIIYVGMVIGDRDLTAKEFYKNIVKTLETMYTVRTTNPPKNG